MKLNPSSTAQLPQFGAGTSDVILPSRPEMLGGGGRGEGVSKSRINTSQNGTKLEGSHTVNRKNFTVNWVLILYFCRSCMKIKSPCITPKTSFTPSWKRFVELRMSKV